MSRLGTYTVIPIVTTRKSSNSEIYPYCQWTQWNAKNIQIIQKEGRNGTAEKKTDGIDKTQNTMIDLNPIILII
jgi:hypothetical protein